MAVIPNFEFLNTLFTLNLHHIAILFLKFTLMKITFSAQLKFDCCLNVTVTVNKVIFNGRNISET